MNKMYMNVGNDYILEDELDSNLLVSKISGMKLPELIKVNELYLKQLSNLVKVKINLILPYNDMKVLNSLLKENFVYLTFLIRYSNYIIEFDHLYSISIQILDNLQKIKQKKVNLYAKYQKLKFYDLKFQSLKLNGTDKDYSDADLLLDEIEQLQYELKKIDLIDNIDICNVKMNRAYIKFCICDFNMAKEYAKNALEILEENNPIRNTKKTVDDEKYIIKLKQVHEFLAELYDLEQDYKNAFECYEKCYYLFTGKYGYNNPLVEPIKKKKQIYQKKAEEMKYQISQQEKEKEFIEKFKGGIYLNSKGTADTFSFIIPHTKIVEPLLISIYALAEENEVKDRFSPDLFLDNIYLDKMKLLQYFGMDSAQYENYILYTDDVLNIILNKIEVVDNQFINLLDPNFQQICINC